MNENTKAVSAMQKVLDLQAEVKSLKILVDAHLLQRDQLLANLARARASKTSTPFWFLDTSKDSSLRVSSPDKVWVATSDDRGNLNKVDTHTLGQFFIDYAFHNTLASLANFFHNLREPHDP